MMRHKEISPWRILIPVGLGTSLSLIGDATLYVVLPTHVSEVGVTLGSVGLLLSANRFIRLILNGPVAVAYQRTGIPAGSAVDMNILEGLISNWG